jgi:phage terminase large subunit
VSERRQDNDNTSNEHVGRSADASDKRDVNVDEARSPHVEQFGPPGGGTTPTGGNPGTMRSSEATPHDESNVGTTCPHSEPTRESKKRLTPQRYLAALAGTPTPPTPGGVSAKANRPPKYTKRSSRDPDAPLPYFTKPDSLQPVPPHLLRRPRAEGDPTHTNFRSRATREAQENARAQARIPTPDQIPPSFDPEHVRQTIIALYRDDPVGFARDLLHVTPDEWQAEAMQSVARGERRLSVRAGHGVGKSAFCSWLVIWHAVTRFPQKTILTSPTLSQMEDGLVSELKSWFRKLPPEILSRFDIQSDRIIWRDAPEDSFISVRTASKERPEALAGIHREDGSVLIVCDEASAIPEAVFESASGSMSGKSAHTILISNPTRNSGLFFDTHHRLSDKAKEPVKASWRTMHISCLDSKRVEQDFVQQIIDMYGQASNAYHVRVLGEFALREDDVLIPAYLIDSAVGREITIDPGVPLVYGIDVGRFGNDRTVICKRQGNVVKEVKWWAKADLMESVAIISQEARSDRPSEICVDSIGIGAGVADRLRELGLPVRDVNVAESQAMNANAHRLRDDLWLQVKDWLNTMAVRLPDDERLKADLRAPTYSFSTTGKTVVESKDLMRRRKLPSPDHADALCLTFAGEAALIGGRTSAWSARGKGPLRRNLAGVV